MRKRLCGLFLFTLLAKHLSSTGVPSLQEAQKGRPTWQRAAKDLHPHADAPIIEPGLGVYADVACHHGDGQLVQYRDLLFTVSFKYLFMHKGEKETLLELDYQVMKESVIHSVRKISLRHI